MWTFKAVLRALAGTRRSNLIAVALFLTFYVLFGAYATLEQAHIIYQPWPQDFNDCPALADAARVTFESTRMYVADGPRGTVVLYHGNAGSACDRAFYAAMFTAAGYGYVMPEYAGYSDDVRQPSSELVKDDVRHVIAYLETRGIVNELVVGESVGSGAASYHVSLRPPRALLLIAPFYSLRDVARRRFWFYPTNLLVDNAFDNAALLSAYHGSVTIIHGDHDVVIAQSSGKMLYEALPTAHKTFVPIPGAGYYNDLFTVLRVREALQTFLAQ